MSSCGESSWGIGPFGPDKEKVLGPSGPAARPCRMGTGPFGPSITRFAQPFGLRRNPGDDGRFRASPGNVRLRCSLSIVSLLVTNQPRTDYHAYVTQAPRYPIPNFALMTNLKEFWGKSKILTLLGSKNVYFGLFLPKTQFLPIFGTLAYSFPICSVWRRFALLGSVLPQNSSSWL